MGISTHVRGAALSLYALWILGCSDSSSEVVTTGGPREVACPCEASGSVSGEVDGREFTGVATGVLEPSIGSLEITLFEGGDPPTCYDNGRAEVRGGTGTRVIISLCIPPEGPRDVGGSGGPVGTHCAERPDSAGVLIVDSGVGDSGELMTSGVVDITSASGECVEGTLSATHLTVTGGTTIMETLSGDFTVPNASCDPGWTDAVTTFCP
jgi:hypothetical protein